MNRNMSIKEIFDILEAKMNSDPLPINGLKLLYQYKIIGQDGGKFQIHIANGSALIIEGETKIADCTLTLSVESFKKMVVGKLNGTEAFMKGKLKIQGSFGLALKLERILKDYAEGI